MIDSSTLRRRLGGLFIVGFPSTTLDDGLKRLIDEYALGGVILFDRNIESAPRLRQLTGEIRKASANPIFISIDQEGGRVQRLKSKWGFTDFPTGKRLGEVCRRREDNAPAFEIGRAMGAEMAAVGIDLDWAPVADVHSNPANTVIGDRAYGRTHDEVIPVAEAFLKGLNSAGIQGCPKHFPGHGATFGDSHQELPTLDDEMPDIQRRDLPPFNALLQQAEMVMTGHILIPAVDGEWPVTLSSEWISGYLRNWLGYSGVVVTDALEMEAIRSAFPLERAATLALRAGCDMLMQAGGYEGVAEAIDSIVDQIEAGEGNLSAEIIEEAAERVDKLKKNLKFQASDPLPPTNWPEHLALVESLDK